MYILHRHPTSKYLFISYIHQYCANEPNVFYKYYWRIYNIDKYSDSGTAMRKCSWILLLVIVDSFWLWCGPCG